MEEMGLYEDVSGASAQVTATLGGQTVINSTIYSELKETKCSTQILFPEMKNPAQTLLLFS